MAGIIATNKYVYFFDYYIQYVALTSFCRWYYKYYYSCMGMLVSLKNASGEYTEIPIVFILLRKKKNNNNREGKCQAFGNNLASLLCSEWILLTPKSMNEGISPILLHVLGKSRWEGKRNVKNLILFDITQSHYSQDFKKCKRDRTENWYLEIW